MELFISKEPIRLSYDEVNKSAERNSTDKYVQREASLTLPATMAVPAQSSAAPPNLHAASFPVYAA